MSRGQEKKVSEITTAEFLKLINLGRQVIAENGGHDIRFVKEGTVPDGEEDKEQEDKKET